MGTSMAPNFAKLFIGNFEQNLFRGYLQKTGLLPLVWFRYIDDIFFIWSGNKDSFDHLISFTQKSEIKLEMHLSFSQVHFLDVTVSYKHGKLNLAHRNQSNTD